MVSHALSNTGRNRTKQNIGGLMKYNEKNKTAWISIENHKALKLLSAEMGKGINYLNNLAVTQFIEKMKKKAAK